MKFTMNKEGMDIFQKTGKVELTGLYEPEDLQKILHYSLAKPLGVRDLCRQSSPLKQVLNLTALGSIVYELSMVKPLRYGFDQLLSAPKHHFEKAPLLEGELPLQERSAVTELVMGALICLRSHMFETHLPFAKEPGDVVFFRPDLPISFEGLKKCPEDLYLLITFVRANSVFVFCDKDPEQHYLKTLGYSYGDKLKDALHPVVFR